MLINPTRQSITRSAFASLVICAGLALADRTLAQETAPGVVSQTGPAQTGPAQTSTATADKSEALLQVIALRRDLEAQVKALSRLVAYQKELLALANTSDVDAVLRARRARQSCRAELGATALCDALSVSFSDDPSVPLSTSRAWNALPVRRGFQESPAEVVDDPTTVQNQGGR